jgi:translation elongation factor EF-Ts
MADQHIRVIQEAIGFFNQSTKSYVSRWQRDHTARLLQEYIQDMQYKESVLRQLQENTDSTKIIKELEAHLSAEKARLQDSEARMQSDLDKARELLEAERAKNARYQQILTQMIAFIQKNNDAFFGFLHRRGVTVDITAFDQIMNTMTVGMLLDICENFELLSCDA